MKRIVWHCIINLLAFIISLGSIYGSDQLPPSNAKPGQTWKCPIDNSVMVYVPAGEFSMGGHSESEPLHKRSLPGYWIDKYEVTNMQFQKFVEATGYCAEGGWSINDIQGCEKYPAINITWKDASAYAEWAGKRLPTEAEWEKAARGIDGRTYPWGNEWDPSRAVIGGSDSVGNIAEVGTHPNDVSPAGCLDMAGNAPEWCLDHCSADSYTRYIKGDSTLRLLGFTNIVRGYGILGDDPKLCECDVRGTGTPDTKLCGFRCVFSPDVKIEFSNTDHPCEMNPSPLIYRTAQIPSQAKPGDVWICPKNNAEMVYVPAGMYMTGYDEDLVPASTGAFWISRYPVTVRAYGEFIKATGYKPLELWDCYNLPGHENHPATGLAYEDAEAYVKWIGQRLPKLNEWEKAARGTDGRPFPWGKEWRKNCMVPFRNRTVETVPNGSMPGNVSPYGIYDMASSNQEWVDDLELVNYHGGPGAVYIVSGKIAWQDEATQNRLKQVGSIEAAMSQGEEIGPRKRLACGCFGPERIEGDMVTTSYSPVLTLAARQEDGKTYPNHPEYSPVNHPFRCVIDAK